MQVSAHRTRMHSFARSSADLSRSRVRQLRISRSCTRAARSCSRSTPVARQIAIRLKSYSNQIAIRLQSTPVAGQIAIRLKSEATHVRSTPVARRSIPPRSDCNQRPSAAIGGHQRPSEAIRGCISPVARRSIPPRSGGPRSMRATHPGAPRECTRANRRRRAAARAGNGPSNGAPDEGGNQTDEGGNQEAIREAIREATREVRRAVRREAPPYRVG